MPLLDTLQSGYPTVQSGQGTSLLDLLQQALASNGSQVGQNVGTPSNYAMGTPDPMASGPVFTGGTGAPMGFGSAVSQQPSSSSQVPPMLADSQSAAQARGEAEYWAAKTPEDRAATAAALGYVPQRNSNATPSASDISTALVPAGTGTFPGAPGQNLSTGDVAAGRQQDDTSTPPAGGLLASLVPAVQTASASPDTSKGLLGTLGATISHIGDKLTNLSPAASQALLASGLTILSGNDGTRNLGQLVGMGGISGLNTYNSARQQQVENAVAQQKLAQAAQQQQTENGIAQQKVNIDAYNAKNAPVVVAPGSTVIQKNGQPIMQGMPQVARTVDVQGQDGKTYTVQLGNDGNQIGQPLLKQNPYAGPLDASAQATVNAAQTAAAQATQTYQRTAQLANALNSADFTGGVGATFNDALTKMTGSKDAGQQLRGQLAQFANNSILSELPPGSASDKDIQLVRNGVPADNAGKDTWQAYLASVGRVQQAAAVLQNAKADYASANRGNLGPLMQAATINGVQYPAGTSFTQVASGVPPQQQQPQAQPTQRGGAVPFNLLQAEARRRGILK